MPTEKLASGDAAEIEVEVKNMARPIRIFRVPVHGDTPATVPAPAAALPDKPAIAVLPFDNMSGDAEQEYFSDGVTEDIISALIRAMSCWRKWMAKIQKR